MLHGTVVKKNWVSIRKCSCASTDRCTCGDASKSYENATCFAGSRAAWMSKAGGPRCPPTSSAHSSFACTGK
eukprot:8318630-Pyramimonas_sp.AAC.1